MDFNDEDNNSHVDSLWVEELEAMVYHLSMCNGNCHVTNFWWKVRSSYIIKFMCSRV